MYEMKEIHTTGHGNIDGSYIYLHSMRNFMVVRNTVTAGPLIPDT